MKIAHIISYFQPKLGYQEFYLAREQKKMGHKVCVITSDRYFPYPNFSITMGEILGTRYVGPGIFNEEGISVIRLPTLFEYATYNFILGLKKTLDNFNPDVVHAHDVSSPITMMTIALKNKFKYKVIVDCHMDYTLRSKSKIHSVFFYLWSRNPICRWLIRRADGFIAVAESSRLWLSNEWGIGREKIKMIPLGAETDIFFPDDSKRKLMRDKLNIAKNEILILYAGKMHETKDIDVLLRSFILLSQKYNNIKIILIGNGSKKYMDKLYKLVEKEKIRKNVLFYPFQSKIMLPYYYNAADIGVWPGDPSITIVEAMSTGVPIIIPNSDSRYSTDLSHYINKDNGFVFTRGNYIELHNLLEKMIIDNELRKNMSKNSRINVVNFLSWRLVCEKTLNYYLDS